jgi:hypothetical protein
MKIRTLLIISVIYFFIHDASAQYFTDIEADLTHVMYAGGSWLDKDDDGDLDLIITGAIVPDDKPRGTSRFYVNVNRNKRFSYKKTGVVDLSHGAADAADYDNDGDMDIIVTGHSRAGSPVTYLYRNDRNNGFKKVNTSIPNLYNGDIKFADYNRDGNPDVAICGRNSDGELQTLVFSGDGKGNFSSAQLPAPGIEEGEMAWGDYNNDGYIDLFITGKNSEGKAFSGLYEFTGDVFQKTGIAFPSRKYSAAAWGDYDNDGNLDIALSGENDNGSVTLRIMRNTRSGFISVNIALPGTRTGSVDWGDYDHDGDIDLLITGETADKEIISRIYRNDRNDTFTDINAGLTGVYLSDAGWGDYDNDGDLDLFLAGLSPDYEPLSKIYRNEHIKKEEEATAKRSIVIPGSEAIWDAYKIPKERRQAVYYFMTSSCFCQPDETYPLKGYHVFISEPFRLEVPYYHQRSFFQEIIDNHNHWGEIKEGHPSEGYSSMEEAQRGRQQFISSYSDEGYEIHHVPWHDHPSLQQ